MLYGFVMRWRTIRSIDIRDRRNSARKDSMIEERSDAYSPWAIGSCAITLLQRNANLTLLGWSSILLCPCKTGWALGIQRHPDSPIVLVHCQDLKKVPHPGGLMSWIEDSSAGRCSHDSRVGRQYHGPHFTGIPLCSCFTS